MATVDQLTQALIAADKAGNTEDARVLAQELAAARKASAPPAEPSSLGSQIGSYAKGIERGIYDIPQSVVELGARGLDATGLTDHAYEGAHEAFNVLNGPEAQDKYSKGGRVVGNIVGTAPLSEIKVLQGGGKIASLLNNAIRGGSAAALTSSGSEAPVGQQIGLGTAVGAGVPVIGGALSKIAAPAVNPMVQKLLDLGVRLTPGQIIGGGIKGAEDKLSSVPVLGSFISGAQKRAVTDFNKAVLNNALEPIGVKLPPNLQAGRKAVDHVATQIGDVYDKTLPRMMGSFDNTLQNDLVALENKATGSGVKADTIHRLGNVLNAQILDKADGSGNFAGDTLKGIQSELSRVASEHLSSENSDDRILGSLISDAHEAWNDMLARNNPVEAQTIQAANAAWARYAQIRKAASAAGAKEGVFSGPQFANAVKATDKSVQKGNYARGKALSQDISDAATSILPSSVPDSGTAGRVLMASALAGGHTLPITAPLATTAALGSAMYTRPGQALIRGLLTGGGSQRQALAALIQAMTEKGSPAAALAANSFAQIPNGGQQ